MAKVGAGKATTRAGKAAKISDMSTLVIDGPKVATDLCSLEADLAFFAARLSLAGEAPDTAYQRAQIKTYQTLGAQIGETIDKLRPRRRGVAGPGRKGRAAA